MNGQRRDLKGLRERERDYADFFPSEFEGIG